MFRNLFLAVLAIGLIAAIATVGCGPRVQVAKDKVINQIDEMLGKLDVKLKDVEMAHAKLVKGTDGLVEARMEAKVRLAKLQADAKELQDAKNKLMADLKDVQPLLQEAQDSSEGSIERNGKTITTEELKAFTDGKIKRVKALKGRMDNTNMMVDAYASNLKVITKNEQTSTAQLDKLTTQIEEIKIKKSRLDTMKQANSILAPGASLSDQFNDLTKDVDDLLIDVDVQVQTEMAKVEDRATQVKDSDASLEELLNDKTDASSTMSELEELLKGN